MIDPNNRNFSALDEELKGWGVPPKDRPLQVFKRLHGVVSDPQRRDELFAPIVDWFIEQYGDTARWDGSLGTFPILIRNVLYEAVALYAFEDRPGVYTEHIRNLPKEISSTFDDDEFRYITERLSQSRASFGMLYNLDIEDHALSQECRDLFRMGKSDLESATTLLVNSHNVQASIVASHEAAEKFLKIALLRSKSKKKPRYFLHDIPALFAELASVEPRYRWLIKAATNLQKLSPSMEMRYRPMQRSEQDAISGFSSALHVCGVLANIWLFDYDRGTSDAQFIAGRFYQSWVGKSFYCKSVKEKGARLTFFYSHPLYGRHLADVTLNALEASLYLEVRDPHEDARLRADLMMIIRSPMQRVTPEEVGLKHTNTEEGTFTTMMVKRRLSRF